MKDKRINPYIYYIKDNKKEKIVYVGKSNGWSKYYITSSKILCRYIKMFGLSSYLNRFQKYIIEECLENELKNKEEYWVKYYNTYYNGLNLTKGGKYDWNRQNIKSVLQYSINGEFIKKWDSGKEAFINLNLSNYDGISSCCKGKQNSSEGYIWRYYELNYPHKIEKIQRKKYPSNTRKYKSVKINDIIYKSLNEALKNLNINKR